MIALGFPSLNECSSDQWPRHRNRCKQMLIDAQARAIAVQARLIRNYQQLANLTPGVRPKALTGELQWTT